MTKLDFIKYQKKMSLFWTHKYAKYAGKERHVVGRMGAPLKEFTSDTKNIKDCFSLVMEPGKSVIDFGCGIGRFVDLLENYFDSYIGVDLVKKISDKKAFYSLEDFLSKDVKVDAIFTCVVLQHITDDDYVDFLIKKFSECLASGGHVYINEQMGDGSILYRGDFPYINRRKRNTYIKMFVKYGFLLERDIPRRDHRLLKFKKVV